MEHVLRIEEEPDMSRAAVALEEPDRPWPALNLNPKIEASGDHPLDRHRLRGVKSRISRFVETGSRKIEGLSASV